MENENINVNVEEVQETEVKEVEVKEKTFTQEELDKIVQKRLAKAMAKKEEEAKEKEELAKLSEADKQKKLFEKQVKEFEETKKAFERERLLNQTTKDLASKNLPVEFSEMLLGVDAESTLANINVFEEKFNSALEKMVNERFKGKTPTTSTAQTSSETSKEEFKKMTMAQRLKLRNENPKRYLELSEQQ